MELKEKLFICAITINFLALWITIFLLGAGAIEGNPIMAHFFSSHGIAGVFMAIFYIAFIWLVLYILYFKIPKSKVWEKATIYSCIVLLILVSIDFLNDLYWLMRYIMS